MVRTKGSPGDIQLLKRHAAYLIHFCRISVENLPESLAVTAQDHVMPSVLRGVQWKYCPGNVDKQSIN